MRSKAHHPVADKQKQTPIHVAARAIILHDHHVLLMAGREPGRAWYILPGGGVRKGERLVDAVRREVLEETGITVTVERPLYLREFIAAKHTRRSQHMFATHHAVATIFLCRPDAAIHGGQTLESIGQFPGDVDGSGAIVAMRWVPLAEIPSLDIMPPHLKRALAGDFPPPPNAGVEVWLEE